MLSISVIIPTLNAASTLPGTLNALRRNTVQPQEILVVDGLSHDGSEEIGRQYDCRFLNNPAKHTSAARQIGIEAAQGVLVAMTDADCIPNLDWVERIRNYFEQIPELDGVGGPVRLDHPQTRVQRYCARKAIEDIPEKVELITRKGMRGRFSGANCAYRKQLLLDINGVNLTFQAHGSDIDLFWRAVDHRAHLLFDPTLSVEHLGFARDYATLANKSFGYGIASARLACRHFPKKKFALNFYWKPWINTIQEFLSHHQQKFPECVFIDQVMFAFGRTWEWIKKDTVRTDSEREKIRK